jgi:hypothetical protein
MIAVVVMVTGSMVGEAVVSVVETVDIVKRRGRL